MALRNGSRFGVSNQDVFPHGCHLLPDSIAEAVDCDPATKTRRQAIDKITGKRVWQCRVQDIAAPSRDAILQPPRQPIPASPSVLERARVPQTEKEAAT